jgi:hypothetical protein
MSVAGLIFEIFLFASVVGLMIYGISEVIRDLRHARTSHDNLRQDGNVSSELIAATLANATKRWEARSALARRHHFHDEKFIAYHAVLHRASALLLESESEAMEGRPIQWSERLQSDLPSVRPRRLQ